MRNADARKTDHQCSMVYFFYPQLILNSFKCLLGEHVKNLHALHNHDAYQSINNWHAIFPPTLGRHSLDIDTRLTLMEKSVLVE